MSQVSFGGGAPTGSGSSIIANAGVKAFPTLPYNSQMIVIFARSGGDDVTGDGSEGAPFETFQRGVRNIAEQLAEPLNIQPGTIYRLDITGIEGILPTDYALPAWKTWAVENVDAPGPLTNFQPGIEIFATPRPVSAIPFADTIINTGDVASVTTDALTGLQTINLNVARTSWTNTNLQGKQVLDGGGNPNNNSIVLKVNSTTSITIANTVAPVFPLALLEPSAWLHGSGGDFGVILANNIDNMGFTGIKITSDNGSRGIYAAGSGNCILQLCEVESPALTQQSGGQFNIAANRVLRTWAYGNVTLSGVVGIVQSLIKDATPISNGDTPFFCAPTAITIRRSAFIACDPISVSAYEPGGNVDPAETPHLLIQNTLIEDGISDGLHFSGGKGHLVNCDFSANAGNGISCGNGSGFLDLANVGSTSNNTGLGIAPTDGIQVRVNAATSGNAHLLTGTAGDMQVGDLDPRTWADFVAGSMGHLAKNEYDITAVSETGAAGTGTRLFQP